MRPTRSRGRSSGSVTRTKADQRDAPSTPGRAPRARGSRCDQSRADHAQHDRVVEEDVGEQDRPQRVLEVGRRAGRAGRAAPGTRPPTTTVGSTNGHDRQRPDTGAGRGSRKRAKT